MMFMTHNNIKIELSASEIEEIIREHVKAPKEAAFHFELEWANEMGRNLVGFYQRSEVVKCAIVEWTRGKEDKL